MFILIKKPAGITSYDVIRKLKKITGEKRIGHSGTLDPFAKGLLIVGIGRNSTKKLSFFLKLKKTYIATIFLGKETDTLDREGNVIFESSDKVIPDKKQILEAFQFFIGSYLQEPPSYSAIKIKGEKAYQLVRQGKDVKLKPRKVKIYKLNLLSYKYPLLKIEVEVSKGTYIRALARDIGRRLGTYAYLLDLERIKIGNYSVADAVDINSLTFKNWRKFVFYNV